MYLHSLNGEVSFLITYCGPEFYSLKRYLIIFRFHCIQSDLGGGEWEGEREREREVEKEGMKRREGGSRVRG